MFKVIALLSKKPGLSRDDFIEYYETKHVPLARKLFPKIQKYKRSFLDLNGDYSRWDECTRFRCRHRILVCRSGGL